MEDGGEPEPWPTLARDPATGHSPSDQMRVAAARAAATAPAADRDLDRVATIGRELVPALVSALPLRFRPRGSYTGTPPVPRPAGT